MRAPYVAAEVTRLQCRGVKAPEFIRASLPRLLRFVVAMSLCCISVAVSASEAKKIVFVAGKPSHGPAQHEHRAGCLLLKSCLDKVPGFSSVVYSNGWPSDPAAFDGVSSVVLYMDGGPGHPALQDDRLRELDSLMKKGVGLVCLHYATEPSIEKGEKEFLNWIGGAFEINWSVNPTWDADFKTLPKHAITHGVKPFSSHDEWYFHLRFPAAMKGITPILTAVAPESTMSRKDGTHEGNPAARESVNKREPQVVAWACERQDGGRGFGFTGGHYHENWGNDDVRKLVLNAIVWSAKAKVPADGIKSSVTPEQLKENLDPKGPKK
jgi:type 1 glutamine amidotransferase